MLLAMAVWWFGSGSHSEPNYHGDATLINLGRIFGLVGTTALLWEIRFSARPSWAQRRLGSPRLFRWHRYNSYVALPLLILHPILLKIGQWSAELPDRLGNPRSTIGLASFLPEIVSLALLIAILLTSLPPVRQVIRYGYWYALHVTAYLAIVLSISHQFHEGADIRQSHIAQVYWAATFIVPLLIIVAVRLVLPRIAVRPGTSSQPLVGHFGAGGANAEPPSSERNAKEETR